MKQELTLTASYCKEWGLREGFREIVANAKDAETEMRAPCSVEYKAGKVIVQNVGVSMAREVLLFGQSSKMDRKDTIGRFGEGLKLGMLAIVRAGHTMKIKTGGETWTPSIAKSAKFDAEVLTIDIKQNDTSDNSVRVEIGGVDEDIWCELVPMFLFMNPMDPKSIVPCQYRGELLLDPEMAGRIYVKGVFVLQDEKYRFGYNLFDATVDRDRKMVNTYDLEWMTRSIWHNALKSRPDLVTKYEEAIESGTQDVQIGYESAASDLPQAALDAMVESFKTKFGKDAMPVLTFGDSQNVEHIGKRGIVVQKAMYNVLCRTFGTTERAIEAMKQSPVKRYSWCDLTDAERVSLSTSCAMVALTIVDCSIASLEVVDFHSADIAGRFDDGKILIARKSVADPYECLMTIVHEAAHLGGADGTIGHDQLRERIWCNIVKSLRKPKIALAN